MPRLPRPPQPLGLKLTVALGQLGYGPTHVEWQMRSAEEDRQLGKVLDIMLARLAVKLGCPVEELRLDHDPPLAAREKQIELPSGRKVHAVVVPKGATVLRYFPDANDPSFLKYRPHSPEYEGSHHIKTNVRGDGAQHPDRVLIKKARRSGERESSKRVTKSRNRVTTLTRNGKKGGTLGVGQGTKLRGKSFQQMRCLIGARCFCDRERRKRCGNYRKQDREA